jgi:hypothetical protein
MAHAQATKADKPRLPACTFTIAISACFQGASLCWFNAAGRFCDDLHEQVADGAGAPAFLWPIPERRDGRRFRLARPGKAIPVLGQIKLL